MPPKKELQDERLQAIVLTDSFETRFMPLTAVRPRCLLPLANVPLLEYTLEFLAKAGVNEVYLMCSSHADQIQAYIDQSKWSKPWSPFKIATIMSLESRSVGDAMRDLDNRALITGDFVLVSGDMVSNIDLSKAMEVHKAKRASDRDHIATMVLSQASQLHRTRSYQEPAAFILEQGTNRCIYYQDMPSAGTKKKGSVAIDPELLEGIDEFVVRNDLIDCYVDICSPHVPAIFQDNFDYQFLRRDFVKGVLSSDLMKKTIYAYITEEYAARAESWQTYDAISQDILARWAYPIVPDSNILETNYQYETKHIYKEENVVLAQSCKVVSRTAIGADTFIGENSIVDCSVIGKNCKIGNNVQIDDSYIWDNCEIGDNTVMDHCIVASNAKVGQGVTLGKGCVIGFGVVIADGQQVPPGVRISATMIKQSDQQVGYSDSEEEEEEDEEDAQFDADVVGSSGVGFVYESDLSDDDDDEEQIKIHSMLYELDDMCLSDSSISSVTKHKKKRTMSTTSYMTSADEDEEDFEKEGLATVERALVNNHDLDTALLELNTLRMSMNVTYHEVRYVTVKAMINRIHHFVSTETLNTMEATSKVFTQWGPLFNRQAFDEEEKIDLLQIILDVICETKELAQPAHVLMNAIRTLYDIDIVDEDTMNDWFQSTVKVPGVTELVEKYISWLAEAEEESSEKESD